MSEEIKVEEQKEKYICGECLYGESLGIYEDDDRKYLCKLNGGDVSGKGCSVFFNFYEAAIIIEEARGNFIKKI